MHSANKQAKIHWFVSISLVRKYCSIGVGINGRLMEGKRNKWGRQNKILVLLEARTDKLLKHSVAIIRYLIH